MPDLTFSIQATSQTPARTLVRARHFELVVDEPPEIGGHDQGANPVEYILTGLVGCLNVVAHLIAREMQLTIHSLDIKAEGVINPDRLFGIDTDDRAGYKQIELQLLVDSDADEATLARWLAVVESRCPVFDNLSRITPVTARVVPLTAARAA